MFLSISLYDEFELLSCESRKSIGITKNLYFSDYFLHNKYNGNIEVNMKQESNKHT